MISIYTLIPINRFEQLLNNLENKNKCRECNFIQKKFFWNHYKIGKFFLFCFIIVFLIWIVSNPFSIWKRTVTFLNFWL
jgi:hypothetical protein